MAWKMGGLCPDAVVYIQVAGSFDKGLLHQAHEFRLNLFPAILMLLHRSGLEWELAGKLWNVAISCLTVLPLYGWVRRQFDDRVALAACCLYAMHAELIRWSPEGIRDPTFWFFLALSLYLLWRATSEVRLPLFLGSGLAMAMAVMTRSEGLFLLVPLLLWSFRTHHAAGAPRPASAGKRLLGAILAVGTFPALLVLASLFWFRGHAPWELVRTHPLTFVEHWIQGGWARLSGGAQADAAASGMGWAEMVELFTGTMFKGVTPWFALLACIGAAGPWQIWKRRDRQVIFPIVLLFFLAIWIHMNFAQETSKRYFLPVVLVTGPLGALGLLACSRRLARWAERRRWGPTAGRWASRLPLLLFCIFSLANVYSCDYRQRVVNAELGRWVHNEFGPSPALLGPAGVTQVVAYYACGRYELLDPKENDGNLDDLLRQGPFDVVLLPDKRETLPGDADLLRRMTALGYAPIDDQSFSDRLRNMLVLVRRTPLSLRERGRG